MSFKLFCSFLSIATFLSLANCQDPSSELNDELTSHQLASRLPGFAVSIVTKNGISFKGGFGFSNIKAEKPFISSSVQNIGSVSKTIVGIALVKAIGQGFLTMDTKVNDVLPFEVTNPFFPDEPILIRHLANHTSSITDTKYYSNSYIPAEGVDNPEGIHEGYLGFINSHKRMSLEVFLEQILSGKGKWYKKKNFLKSSPGAVNEYANLNSALAAYIVELVTDTPFDQYCTKYIFSPLDMSSTSWSLSQISLDRLNTRYFPAGAIVPAYSLITYPDGGLYSSVEDMSKLLQEIILAYAGQSTFLPIEYARLLLPGDSDRNRAFWGMGAKSRNIGHAGSDPGVQVSFQFNADNQIGRVIFSNVNAEDNESLYDQYRRIHTLVDKHQEAITRLK